MEWWDGYGFRVRSALKSQGIDEGQPTTWTPNQPGVSLHPGEAAELCCLLQEIWPLDPKHERFTRDGTEYHPFAYTLNCDTLGAGEVCVLCGAPKAYCANVTLDYLTWSAPICGGHHAEGVSMWDRLKAVGPTAEVAADERIRRWVEMQRRIQG